MKIDNVFIKTISFVFEQGITASRIPSQLRNYLRDTPEDYSLIIPSTPTGTRQLTQANVADPKVTPTLFAKVKANTLPKAPEILRYADCYYYFIIIIISNSFSYFSSINKITWKPFPELKLLFYCHMLGKIELILTNRT